MRTLLAVAAIVLLASACGGSEDESSLAEAAERTEATGSSAFALTVVQQVGDRSETYACDGSADYTARRMRLVCGDDGEFLALGRTYYARGWGGFPLGVPADKPWVRVPLDAGQDTPHDLAPGVLLAKLRAADVGTERIGEDEVRGVETVRYRMTVRCDEAELDCSGTETADVEVWIDDDGLVRRVLFEDDGAEVTAEYFDFGEAVDVNAPPADQVTDLATPSLGPCAGGGVPITDVRLRRALVRHGFEVAGQQNECLTGIVAQLAGILLGAGGANSANAVYCHVHGTAPPNASAAVHEGEAFGVRSLALRNVACSSLGRVRPNDVALERLREALAEIARALGP